MPIGHSATCVGTPCACERSRYTTLLWLAAGIAIAEVVGGYQSGSLALLADAGHVLADAAGLLVGIAVAEKVRAGANERVWRAIGCVASSLILLAVAIGVNLEANQRLCEEHAVTGWAMFFVAFIGLAGNYLQHYKLEEVEEHERHVTHRSMSAHVLSDMAMSVLAIASGAAVWVTDVAIVDPLFSLAGSGLLAYLAIRTVRDGWRTWRGHKAHTHHH